MSDAADKPKVPKLRFPEFQGEWKQGTLGDYFTFKNGVNADKSMYGSGRKFINVMDVIADAPIIHDAIIGSVEISDSEFKKNEVVYGDILFQRSSETREEVGQSNVYLDDRPVTFGGFVIRGRPKVEIDARYFDALLKTALVRKDMTSRSGGSTRYNIGQEALELVEVLVATDVAEQTKIADFLGALASRAVALERQRMALTAYKNGMMQRLFSRKLRFISDDGSPFPDWEKREFSELAEPSGDRFDPSNTTELPLVIELDDMEAGTGRIHRLSGLKGQVSQKTIFREGDVLFAKLRPYLRKFWKATIGGVCSTEIWVLRPKSVSSDFLHALVQTSKFQQLANQSAGSKMPRADWKVVGGASFAVPHADEAEKIASFLSAIDDRIEAVTKQLEVFRVFKSGLLQQMFV